MKLTPSGSIRTSAIVTNGAGYLSGQIVTVNGGANGKVKILTTLGTVPLVIRTEKPGKNYTDNTTQTTAGGPGAGLTVHIRTVLVPTLFIPPGSGDIQQGGKTGQIARKRTIQHQSFTQHRYSGALWVNPNAQALSFNNRNLLALMAHYWSNSLTAGQRLAWDAVALPGKNGFDAYMAVNKTSQGLVFSQPFAPIVPFTPPFPTATGFSPYVISALVTKTDHALGPDDGCRLQVQFNIAPAFDSFSLLFPVYRGKVSTDAKKPRYQMERFVYTPPPVFTCCAFLSILLFGNLPTGSPISAFIRPWDSVTGITGDVYTTIVFPA